MIHQLKCESKYFEEIISGIKTFEVRKNDRNYKVGDYLALNEVDYILVNNSTKITGRSALFQVVYILDVAEYCKDDYVILGILPCRIDLMHAGHVAHVLEN